MAILKVKMESIHEDFIAMRIGINESIKEVKDLVKGLKNEFISLDTFSNSQIIIEKSLKDDQDRIKKLEDQRDRVIQILIGFIIMSILTAVFAVNKLNN